MIRVEYERHNYKIITNGSFFVLAITVNRYKKSDSSLFIVKSSEARFSKIRLCV